MIPGDLVQVPKSVRMYASICEAEPNTYSLLDKEDTAGFALELALVISTEPATLLFIISDRPRWRWIWPGSEHLLVKESTATGYGKVDGS